MFHLQYSYPLFRNVENLSTHFFVNFDAIFKIRFLRNRLRSRVYAKLRLGHGPGHGPPCGLPYGPPQCLVISPIIKKIIATYMHRDQALQIPAIAAIFSVMKLIPRVFSPSLAV